MVIKSHSLSDTPRFVVGDMDQPTPIGGKKFIQCKTKEATYWHFGLETNIQQKKFFRRHHVFEE